MEGGRREPRANRKFLGIYFTLLGSLQLEPELFPRPLGEEGIQFLEVGIGLGSHLNVEAGSVKEFLGVADVVRVSKRLGAIVDPLPQNHQLALFATVSAHSRSSHT